MLTFSFRVFWAISVALSPCLATISSAQESHLEQIKSYDARLEREKERLGKIPVTVVAIDGEREPEAKNTTSARVVKSSNAINIAPATQAQQTASIQLNHHNVIKENSSQKFIYRDVTSRSGVESQSCCANDEAIDLLLKEMRKKEQ